jgi:putative FmdB family regulatory protein
MPIYEYWCHDCDKEFEELRPMSRASEPAACPTCGAPSEKLPSVFASKADYTIKVPRGGALRQQRQTGPAAAAGGDGERGAGPASPPSPA